MIEKQLFKWSYVFNCSYSVLGFFVTPQTAITAVGFHETLKGPHCSAMAIN